MVDIPITGRTLDGYVSERVIQNLLAIDAAHEVAVFVREIPRVAASDAVKAVVEEVDLIAVEDGIAVAVDIDRSAGQTYLTVVAQVLVVLGAILRLLVSWNQRSYLSDTTYCACMVRPVNRATKSVNKKRFIRRVFKTNIFINYKSCARPDCRNVGHYGFADLPHD